MTSIIKVDQIQTAAGGVPTAADLGLNVSGSVVQTVTAQNSTNVNAAQQSAWVQCFSFQIHNVTAGNSVTIEVSPSGLMEHAGTVLVGVFKGSQELGRSVQHSNGNGGWRTAPVTIMVTDTNPTSGTNTYDIKFYSTNAYCYINYPLSGFNGVTHCKMQEIAG